MYIIGLNNFLNIFFFRCCQVCLSVMEIEALWTHLGWIWQCELSAQILINTDFLDFKIDFKNKHFFIINICEKNLLLMVAEKSIAKRFWCEHEAAPLMESGSNVFCF